MNPGPLQQETDVFPLDHSLFLLKLHLTLIITLRMVTCRYKRRIGEWDLNPGPLQEETDVFPLDHSVFMLKLYLTLIITLRMVTCRYKNNW